jgi:hypothetical protein
MERNCRPPATQRESRQRQPCQNERAWFRNSHEEPANLTARISPRVDVEVGLSRRHTRQQNSLSRSCGASVSSDERRGIELGSNRLKSMLKLPLVTPSGKPGKDGCTVATPALPPGAKQQ